MDGGDEPEKHQYWRKWTDAEIAEKTAEAWENDTWTTPPLASWESNAADYQTLPSSSTVAQLGTPMVGAAAINSAWDDVDEPRPQPASFFGAAGVTSLEMAGPATCHSQHIFMETVGHHPSSSTPSTSQMADGSTTSSASSTSHWAAGPTTSLSLPSSSSQAVAGPWISSSSSSSAPHPAYEPEVTTLDEATTWDENISLAMQEEEVLEFFDSGLAPIPEDLPLPSRTPVAGDEIPEETNNVVEPRDDANQDEEDATPAGTDWWIQIADRRGLRGRPVPPLSPLPQPVPGRNPTEWATPKSSAPQGIIQRGNKLRTGVDRWHHADGSVRNRQRERLAAEAAAAKMEAEKGDSVEREGEHVGHPVAPVSFYKQGPKHSGNASTTATEPGGVAT